jgi:hypothetical protein
MNSIKPVLSQGEKDGIFLQVYKIQHQDGQIMLAHREIYAEPLFTTETTSRVKRNKARKQNRTTDGPSSGTRSKRLVLTLLPVRREVEVDINEESDEDTDDDEGDNNRSEREEDDMNEVVMAQIETDVNGDDANGEEEEDGNDDENQRDRGEEEEENEDSDEETRYKAARTGDPIKGK